MAITLRNGRTTIENAVIDALWLAYGFRYPVAATVAALRALDSTALPDRALRFVTAKGLTYIWRRFVATADDGDAYVRPADVDSANPGRWVKTASTAATGYLKRCELYNDNVNDIETIEERLFANMPAMLLSFESMNHKAKSMSPGALYWATIRFQLQAVSVSERAEQTARQGSLLAAEAAVDPGTAAMLGDAKAVLAGYALGLDDVATTEIGDETPQIHDLARARFTESLDITVYATLTNQDTDLVTIESFGVQEQLADLAQDGTTDEDNLLTIGMAVPIAVGLFQPVNYGTAIIGGTPVTFVGEMRTFGANKDTYRDLLDDGTMIYVAVDNGADAPDVTSTAMRIGVTVTDASGVVADRILCASAVDFGDVNEIT
jgi:hypothetical protein